ncbi:uncharacterized protein LOC122243208 [Penaeus japonicus]|uniref:uncharacterized protein LOC122243208 n=1 Tax=Penaeus japonicus TaxID=27405 RepID=UPI001C70BB2D|nr:uncharacterized protein LOC122243208 [Penaeus japonicus]
MATRRKMSMSSLLGDVRKQVRKMTIHDPSSVASLVGSLTHLRVLEEDTRRGRASSEPPATTADTHSDCSSDEKELEDDLRGEPELAVDDEDDDDELYIAFMIDMQEADSTLNGKYQSCLLSEKFRPVLPDGKSRIYLCYSSLLLIYVIIFAI